MSAATEGTALPGTTQVATFTDTNTSDTASDFTATINWGDGTTTAGTVSGSAGAFTVAGGHTYADEGTDTAQRDRSTTRRAAPRPPPSGTVAVAEGDTLVARCRRPSRPAPGQPFSGTVATFTDTTYPNNVAGDFTATINWGDGTTTTPARSAAAAAAPSPSRGTHTYADAGTDTVTVVLDDDAAGHRHRHRHEHRAMSTAQLARHGHA